MQETNDSEVTTALHKAVDALRTASILMMMKRNAMHKVISRIVLFFAIGVFAGTFKWCDDLLTISASWFSIYFILGYYTWANCTERDGSLGKEVDKHEEDGDSPIPFDSICYKEFIRGDGIINVDSIDLDDDKYCKCKWCGKFARGYAPAFGPVVCEHCFKLFV